MATADDAFSSPPAPPPPPPPPSVVSSLAPGFRFHPTDQELVSYYLRRKVLALPLRVDAISEVDLYKALPWDLPQMSRIQSRDMEWYFFSPLDRKYANRSRTNRATGKGYWKTTGKDRPVTSGSRVVGMKKTLVYHIGRAPKGERTNWVMHEYRLEDEKLIKAAVPQDEYVVCRIFQKSGAGPQNGAQYGAPFLEEEWESDNNMLLPDVFGSEEQTSVPGRCQQLTPVDDYFEQERKDVQSLNQNGQVAVADEQLNTSDFVSVKNGQDITDPPVSNKLQENPESFTAMDQNTLCGMNDDQRFGMDQYYGQREQHHNQGYSEDDYLELKDVIDSPHVDYQGNQIPGIRNDQVSNSFSQITNLPKLHDVEEFFDCANGNEYPQQPIGPFSPFDDSTSFGMNVMLDPVVGNYPSGEQADNNVYYDAPDHNTADVHGGYIEMNDFLYPLVPGSPTSDPVDELMAYFDATEDQIQTSHLEYPPREESSLSRSQPKAEASVAGVEKGVSSTLHPGDEKNASGNGDNPVAGGMESRKDWDKTFAGRLVGILGSFPAPPALAAERPMKEGKSLEVRTSALPSTSMQITAGMIQINGMTVADDRGHWSIPKRPDAVQLSLDSLDLARNGFVSNTEKMHGGVISLIIRSGICFPILSILFLAISFKMAICIYSR